MKLKAIRFWTACWSLLALIPLLAAQDPNADREVRALLEPIRQETGVPALGAALLTSKGITLVAAVGVRKAGTDIPVTVDDDWHLGSNTKAMTSTVIAKLVEKGKLRWETTLEDCFPDLVTSMSETVRKITLLQLLSHRSGLPANLAGGWHQIRRDVPTPRQRLEVIEKIIREPLVSESGSRYLYSNLGYTVAAGMAEKATGTAWEELMSTMIFEPLSMKSVGFGGLGTPGKPDQPWPHLQNGTPAGANGPDVDNPPVLGPAGTVHCSLADWAKFVGDQLKGELGQGALLRPETYRKLHTPLGGEYGLGWQVVERPWGGGKVFMHNGSNTMNFATVWVAPLRDFAVIAVTNQGGDKGFSACDKAVGALVGFRERTHTRP